MQKIALRLATALVLTSAPLLVSPSFAQEKERGGAAMERGQGNAERSRPSEAREQPSSGPSERSARPAPESKGTGSERAGSKSDTAGSKSDRSAKSSDERAGDEKQKSGKSADRKPEPADKTEQSDSKRRTDTRAKTPDDNKEAADSKAKDNKEAKDKAGDKDRERAERPATGPDQAKGRDDGTAKTEVKDDAARDREKPEKVRSADVSGDKRERVTKTLRDNKNVKHITNVDVQISVGRRLPREWDYYPVPSAVISIVPEYRGYRYAYIEDEYVIVDPDTYEVVYVLESGGSSSRTAGSGGGECSNIALSEADRTFVIEKVRHTSGSVSVDVGDLSIGFKLPGSVRVETFPSEVTSRVGTLESCRYVVVEDRVAIVDPHEDKVITILD